MFNWKDFEKTKVILSQSMSYKELIGQHHVTIRPSELLRWIEFSKEDMGYLTLVDIAALDLEDQLGSPYRFEMNYHLLNMGSHQRLNIHVCFNADEIVPSIVELFSQADWMEREQHEAFGIHFNRDCAPLLLPLHQEVYPLRKNAVMKDWPLEAEEALPTLRYNPNKSEAPYPEESYVWKKFGLLSPETSGLFEWWLCLDPSKVVDSKVKIGFHHQGFEKLLETKDWQQSLQLVDKLQLGAAPTYAIAWVKGLEDLLRVKLPERAQAIRIVALELARIAEHLTVMHDMTYALELHEHRLFVNAREKIYEIMEQFCGHRQGLNIVRLGGMRADLPHGWIVEYQAVAASLQKTLKMIHQSLMGQRKFRQTLQGGSVNAQTVLNWGISGPTMRASGLNFDLRKSQPFYFYQDIDFDVPVGIYGTAYDRYLIRFEEIHQSFRIITQVIDNLPLGEFMNPEFDKDYFELKKMLMTQTLEEGWHYTGIESPNGEAGFSVKFFDCSIPYRVKIKTPSFSLVQALAPFLAGVQEGQLKPCLASIGVRRFELDR
jgi:NADH-quinone oxidoreductase subunit C/D